MGGLGRRVFVALRRGSMLPGRIGASARRRRREADTPFIKRVIGVAGDRVVIRDGAVTVNGVTLDERYTDAEPRGGPPQPTEAAIRRAGRVPAGDVFLLGDHRAVVGQLAGVRSVALDSIVGGAWLRYWLLSSFGGPAARRPYPSSRAAAPSG